MQKKVDNISPSGYTISMKTLKKTALALCLFFALAGFSYADTFFSIGMGYNRLSDEYLNDSYGRVQNGFSLFILDFSYYPEASVLGFFAKVSLTGFLSGYEWQGETNQRGLDNSYSDRTDLRLFLGPSYKFQLGERLYLPISLGPVFSFYWEDIGKQYGDKDYYYEALKIGVFADVAFVILPSDSFFLKPGISFGWDFFNAEKGTMDTYRRKVDNRYRAVPYSEFVFSLSLGFGWRFN
jgi:hypothetical protein